MLKRPVITTLWQLVGKAITVAVSLITVRLLTRNLGVDGYGNFTLITSSFLLFDAVADMGTRMIGVRELAQAKEGWSKSWQHIIFVRWLLTAGAFSAGLIFCFLYPGFANIRTEAVLALVVSWGTMMAGNLEIVWQWKIRLDLKALIDVLFPVFFLVWFFAWHNHQTLLIVMAGYLIARLVSVGLGMLLTLPYWRQNILKAIDWRMVKRLWIETWPVGLYLLIFTSYDRAIDSLLIRHFMGAREVAWYGLAYKIYGSLLMPAYYFVSSIFPLLSTKGKEEEVVKKGRRLLMAMVALGAPLVYFLAPLAVDTLGGADFEPSIGVLRILIGAVFFAYLNHLSGFSLVGQGRQKQLLVIGVLVLGFNAAANLITIPLFGIYAAAWVTVGSEGLMALLLWVTGKSKK